MRAVSGYIQKILHSSLNHCLQQYFKSLPTIKIIQVGANDGEKLDPVVPLLQQFNCKAILVEAIPNLCLKLEKRYSGNPNIRVVQKAITPQNNRGDLPFYHFERKKNLSFRDDFTLWGSFSREHLEKFRQAVPNFEELITCTMVPTMGVNDLLEESGFDRVDYLQVDAEGFDEQLISAIDLNRHKPSLIRFEHTHSNRQKVFGLLEKLSKAGYQTFSLGMDTICISGAGKKYFGRLSAIKALHSNWLMPAKPLGPKG